MFSQLQIIAEIGVNHNGSIKLAFKLIDAAKKAGATAVKFQTFKTSNFVNKGTPKVKYQKENDKSLTHYEMIKKLELSYDNFKKIKSYCEKKNILFISTPYDLESAIFLNSISTKCFKTSAADLSDFMLHDYLSKTKSKVIISTGMSNNYEIAQTLKLYDKKKVAILHCVSNYPCSYKSLNLNCIPVMMNKFKIPVGFSDHSIGYEAAMLSYMFGCRIFEKHFTLSKKMEGPDHAASVEPNEFSKYVEKIKLVKKMLGTNKKRMQKEEKEMKTVSTKSITLNKKVKKNEKITLNDISLKRPGKGLNGFYIKKIIGKKVKKNLNVNYQLKLSDLK